MLSKRILMLMFLLVFLLLIGCEPSPDIPVNEAPIITSDPNTTAIVGEVYTYDVEATDPDGDTLTYSLATPAGMTINSATGLIEWTPTAEGDYGVIVKVSDGDLDITQSFTIMVIEEEEPGPTPTPPVNHAPVINSIPITTAVMGVAYIYDVEATDPDGDTLTYSLTTNPSGMAINSTTGVISWIPTAEGSYGVAVEVSDGELSDFQGFTIIVSTVEISGIVVLPKTMTLIEGEFGAIQSVTATYVIKADFEAPILLGDCAYQSSNIVVAALAYTPPLFDIPAVFAEGPGEATITVTYADKTDTIVVTVLPIPPPVHNVTQDGYYNTIQAAIDSVMDDGNHGDTILVAPGVYNEYILIERPLILQSTDGAESTIIDGVAFRYMVRIYSSDVTFEGFTVTNPTYTGGSDASGILVADQNNVGGISNIQILNNIITQIRSETGSQSMYGATGINIGKGPLSDIVISGNTIMDIDNPDGLKTDHTCGINIWDGADNVLISNNDISDIKYNGIILQWASNVQIEGNSVSECEVGIRVEPFGGVTVSGLTINLNNFADNPIQVFDDAQVLDIQEVLDTNDFDRAVVVDHEGSSLLYTIWSNIQDAINEAVSGDTVIVAAGTYDENITIDRSLTVISVDGAEVTIIDAQGVLTAVLINGADTVATFEGFTVTNYDKYGIKAGSGEDDSPEVHILNNIVEAPLGDPHTYNIHFSFGATGTVIGNEASGLGDPAWANLGIHGYCASDVFVSNNYVHDCLAGIWIMGAHVYKGRPAAENNIIESNLIENCETGITIQHNSIDTIISYNDVLNNDGGIEVKAVDSSSEQASPSGTEIHQNNIVDNELYGVKSFLAGSDTGTVLAEEVDATYNWWGSEYGPKHNGFPLNGGDAVSDNVDYENWLLSEF